MEPQTKETFDSQNEEQENTDSQNSEHEQSEDSNESNEEYTEREKQYYARIKKLEADLKEAKTAPKPKAEKKSDLELTPKDTLAFMATGITEEEDIEEVLKLAKGFGMSVSEALKDETVKHRLNVLKEQRKSAEASNTRSARSGAKTIDSKELLNKLSKGEVPKRGSNEAEELFWARRGGKR
jgi:hypothetical protein